ncbi:MAG: exopolysaccharide biosynthesis protein [Thainema sp.]
MARLSAELQQYFFEVAPARSVTNEPVIDKPEQRVCLRDILDLAGERTFGFLFVCLALPSALPIPAPGYSTPFGIVMLVLAIQLAMGRERPWLPQKWNNRSFELTQIQKLIKAGVPWLQRIEIITRPRLSPICKSRTGQLVMGIAIAILSISMISPLPLTNTAPAFSIFVMGFGLLDDDGFISIGGMTLGVVALALSAAVHVAFFWGGMAAVEQLRELI